MPATPASAAASGAQQTSGMAVASMIFGFLFFLFPAAIVAVILGHISNSEIRKSAGRLKGAGMALTGIILGYAGVALFPIVVIALIVVLIPGTYKKQQQDVGGNELAAINGLRTISTAAAAYHHKYGVYPATLEALGPPKDGHDASAEAAGLLGSGLALGLTKGYIISYSPLSTRRYGEWDEFNAEADPLDQGFSGLRHFHVDESGVIREQKGDVAGRGSPVLK